MVFTAEEQEHIRDIEDAKEWYDQATALLGDREPDYLYLDNDKIHTWGFGDPHSPHGDRKHIFHRADAPCMFSDKPKMAKGEIWQVFGSLHRLDGPAFSNIHGGHEWWLYGVPLTSWRVYGHFSVCSKEELLISILKDGGMKGTEWNDIERFTLTEISVILSTH